MILWRLYLDDGSVITEGNEDYKSSANVPPERVARVEYITFGSGGCPTVSLDIDLDKGERFFRFWRRTGVVGEGGVSTVFCMGKYNAAGEKILTVYLYDNGEVVISHYHEL